MYYSEDLIEEVRSRNDIVDVIGSRVQLKKTGGSYVGLCPFHSEKTPSFSVSGSRQIFHCFGCGVGGNVITFLMKYENYSFQEALQSLADRAGIQLPKPEYTKEQRQKADLRSRLLQIQKDAATYYYRMLRSGEGKQAWAYLTGRGLTAATIKSFGLGYTGKSGSGLYRYLKEKGYADELLFQSGLVLQDEKRGPTDRFWNRVIFPIMDINHHVIGFGGRVMGDAKPKYLNSPETAIFEKSRNLYGMNFARTSRRKGMILCEGYMDVIAMHQAGFTNAVASLGTALTPGHASLVKRYSTEALLLYDSDEAGVKAALRAIPILRDAGITARVVDLKPHKDPDEFIRTEGAEAFEKRLADASNSFLFEIGILQREYDMRDPTQKTAFYQAVADKLLRFTESLERQNYIEATAHMLQIGTEELTRFVNAEGIRRGGTVPVRKPRPAPAKQREKDDGDLRTQGMLLTWLTEDPPLYEIVKRYVTPEDFAAGVCRETAALLFAQLADGDPKPARIISHFPEEDEQKQAAALFHAKPASGMTKEEQKKVLSELLYQIKARSFARYKAGVNAADMQAMQTLIARRRELDKLRTGQLE